MVAALARKILQSHPVLVNAVIYGGLYVGAELSQQVFTRKVMVKSGEEKDIDVPALGRYLAIGSGFNAHYLYLWYKWLDSRFVGNGAGTVAKKLLLDQLVMSPPLYAIFYVAMSLMEGRDDPFEECRRKFLKTLAMSYLFWVPFQVINFVFLPNSVRVMYLGTCSFAWMNILCWVKREEI